MADHSGLLHSSFPKDKMAKQPEEAGWSEWTGQPVRPADALSGVRKTGKFQPVFHSYFMNFD